MDLTSRDGDWFLDELCSMSANISQLVALLQQHYPLGQELQDLAQRATLVIHSTHHVYLSLQVSRGIFAQKRRIKLKIH